MRVCGRCDRRPQFPPLRSHNALVLIGLNTVESHGRQARVAARAADSQKQRLLGRLVRGNTIMAIGDGARRAGPLATIAGGFAVLLAASTMSAGIMSASPAAAQGAV